LDSSLFFFVIVIDVSIFETTLGYQLMLGHCWAASSQSGHAHFHE